MIDVDVLVIGGGPAGITAACRAAEAGRRTAIIDQGFFPGGQIYRRLPHLAPPVARAARWIARLERSGASVHVRTAVIDAYRAGFDDFRVTTAAADATTAWRARRIVLATGARELFLPFPGWTLPGVLGAGAIQAMVKSGAELSGRRVVVAGTGPLLWPVAKTLKENGANVLAIVERASRTRLFSFCGAILIADPKKVVEAAGYRTATRGIAFLTGSRVRSAHGHGRLSRVAIGDHARTSIELECDFLAIGEGLTPNAEIAQLFGAEVRAGAFRDGTGHGARIVAGDDQSTNVPGVFAAGECTGIGGVDPALVEGEIAGLAAAEASAVLRREGPALFSNRAAARLTAQVLSHFFPHPTAAAGEVSPDSTLCRCEDTAIGAAHLELRSSREMKLMTRAGMGPCQGRICGPARMALGGPRTIDRVQPPLEPAAFRTFDSMGES